ncbi:ClpP class serine protease [Stella humosa]|uniref:ClpP class serine protease n=1 Tax=Stella humosa TaxID=94 RepID=A0A3N1MAJ0_9PROT|nr:S49 family peptidase [Stella humosa]ROP99716.1 ClpP class serine protease [Stella humosa]
MLIDRLAARFGIKRPPIVPVVRLDGVIGRAGAGRGSGLTLAGLAPVLDRAFAMPGAKDVALVVNSPGGSPAQSSLIARRIRDLATAKGIRVTVFVEDVAASGGYWLALAGDEIIVDPASLVGSIGVIAAGFGFADAIGRLGIERRVHTAGERKSLWDPFLPEKPEDVARLLAIQADMHQVFRDHVTARRGERLKGPPDLLFSGEIWVGARAVEMGLADGIGEIRSTMRARLGADVRLPLVNPPRKRRFNLLPKLGAAPADWIGAAVDAAEERANWARWGL